MALSPHLGFLHGRKLSKIEAILPLETTPRRWQVSLAPNRVFRHYLSVSGVEIILVGRERAAGCAAIRVCLRYFLIARFLHHIHRHRHLAAGEYLRKRKFPPVLISRFRSSEVHEYEGIRPANRYRYLPPQ